jgi:hypothetical protein
MGADPPPMSNTCEACRNASDCAVEAHRLTISALADEVANKAANVRLWHKADMDTAISDVRFQG